MMKINLFSEITVIETGFNNLAVCVRFSSTNFKDYNGLTYLQLEKLFDKEFNLSSIEIFLEFQNRKIQMDWNFSSKVIFKRDHRCYLIEAFWIAKKYQNYLSLFKLVIRPWYHKVFLFPQNQLFNSQSYRFLITNAYTKRIIKRSKLNKKDECFDYTKLPCLERVTCIDTCVNREYYKLYQNISNFVIIQKHEFRNEWSKLRFDYHASYDLQRERLEKVIELCEKKNPKKECTEITIAKSGRIKSYDPFYRNYNLISGYQIDLFYDFVNTIEEEPSVSGLLLDLLNLQIIIFGYSGYKFVNQIFKPIRLKFKKYLMNVICFTGAIYYLWFIFDQIIHGDLVFSQFYKISEFIDMPKVILCFKYNDRLIDQKRKFNFDYLDEYTKSLNIGTIFEKIEYLNASNKWISFDDFKDEKKFSDSNSEFKIKRNYYLDKKCFEIRQNVIYRPLQFYLSDNDQVLRMQLNRSLIEDKDQIISFLTKLKKTQQFSKLLNLVFIELSIPKPPKLLSNHIRQNGFEIVSYDQFSWIKNLLALFIGVNEHADKKQNLNRMIYDFEKNYNLEMVSLSIQQLNSESDNDLMKLLDKILKKKSFHSSHNSNYQKLFAINYLEKKELTNNCSDLSFSLGFFRRVIMIENRENHSKLILNIINLFSFWFDLGVLDLYVPFYRLKNLLLKLYESRLKNSNKIFKF